MTIIALSAFTDNYIWLLTEPQQNEFHCVDPGDAQPVLDWASKNHKSLGSILLTHHHQDHIAGVHALKTAFPQCQVYAPSDPRIPELTHVVSEGSILPLGENNLTVINTPGHTSTHISYYEADKGLLFCGDTLFSAGCGRVFDGSIEQLYQSLLRLKALPKSTKVFCAHEYTLQNLRFAATVEPNNPILNEYLHQLMQVPKVCSLPSTIELEWLINPFFRVDSTEVAAFAVQHGAISSNPLHVFAKLRELKNQF